MVVSPSQAENEQITENESFMGRLLLELVGVYLRLSNSGRSSVGGVEAKKTRSKNSEMIEFCFSICEKNECHGKIETKFT